MLFSSSWGEEAAYVGVTGRSWDGRGSVGNEEAGAKDTALAPSVPDALHPLSLLAPFNHSTWSVSSLLERWGDPGKCGVGTQGESVPNAAGKAGRQDGNCPHD